MVLHIVLYGGRLGSPTILIKGEYSFKHSDLPLMTVLVLTSLSSYKTQVKRTIISGLKLCRRVK